ncbi:SagB/ThcOx family dehydrogenase [Amycolatopsis sp. NPDC054798]
MTDPDLLESSWRINPLLRLTPPGAMGDAHWAAVHLLRKKKLVLGKHGAAMCLLATNPVTGGELVNLIHHRSGADKHRLEEQLRGLVGQDALVEAGAACGWAEELLTRWRDRGWIEAADHHLMTFDYDFFDYSTVGWKKDLEIMREYRAEQPDLMRFKPPSAGCRTIRGPATLTALAGLDADFEASVRGPVAARQLDRAALLNVLAAVFGVTMTVRGNDRYAPPIRRTSPSGGSRHPSEGYVCVFDVPGLDAGWYHFSCGSNVLAKTAGLDSDEAAAALYGAFRAGFPVGAVIVITSQFERNMYRYREPRTFRTLFMDVGHLLATTELVARSLGLELYGQHGIDDTYVEHVLGLNEFEEGVLYSIALGDGVAAPAAEGAVSRAS